MVDLESDLYRNSHPILLESQCKLTKNQFGVPNCLSLKHCTEAQKVGKTIFNILKKLHIVKIEKRLKHDFNFFLLTKAYVSNFCWAYMFDKPI